MTETLNGRTIKKSHQTLPLWTGPKIKDTYGNKTVLDYQGQPLFVELKRKGKDSIRQTQIDFLERALQAGVPAECFEIYEWVPAARP